MTKLIQLPNGDWIDPAEITRASMNEAGGFYFVWITTPTAHGPTQWLVMETEDPLKAAAERDRLAELCNAAWERVEV